MAYPCDLPANMGNTDILRAIYAKQSDTGKIEEKLDYLIGQVGDVNNNIQLNTEAIEENTKAIKDISINVSSEDLHSIAIAIYNQTEVLNKQTQAIKDISINVVNTVVVDTKDLSEHIDKVSQSIDTLNSSLNATLQNLKPGPVPPRPHPHPHPHPVPPPIKDDIIFYPVPLGLPARKPIVFGSRCAGNIIFNHHYDYKKVEHKPEPIKQKKAVGFCGRYDDMIFRDSPVYKSRVEEAKMKYNSIKPRCPVKK